MADTQYDARLLLADFPQVAMAFAYGSGVFTQLGNGDAKTNMLDVLFVVDNTVEWHKENLTKHRPHYSAVRYLGPKLVSYLQDDCAANIYYNTLVQWKGRLLKYGVINRRLFLEDLRDWRTLYVSGRLHKPVMHLGCCPLDIQGSLEVNLRHAVKVALLCLPDRFTDQELYLMISNLSYAGDFRMIVGENKDKVSNIVKPNLERFRNLYRPLLAKYPHLHITNENIEQKSTGELRHQYLMSLPLNVKRKISQWGMGGLIFPQFRKPSPEIQEAVLYSLAQDRAKTTALTLKATRSIVRSSSILQSLKGIVTAGVLKSSVYGGQKLGKMLRGMFK